MSSRGPYNEQLTKSVQYTKLNRFEIYPEVDPKNAKLSQKGKVIIGIAWAFAQTKPKAIVLVARKLKDLENVSAEIHAIDTNIEVLNVPTDISDEKAVDSLFETIAEAFGGADVLVNNAGTGGTGARIRDADPSTWWEDFQINSYGTFLVSRAFLRLIGTEKQGTIVTVASQSSFLDLPGLSSYLFSKLLSLEIAHFIAIENKNVVSIAMHPGVIRTAMVPETSPFYPYSGDSVTLAGAVVAYLASEEAQWLDGRYCLASWDMVELCGRKEEILKNNDLVMGLRATLGAEHYV